MISCNSGSVKRCAAPVSSSVDFYGFIGEEKFYNMLVFLTSFDWLVISINTAKTKISFALERFSNPCLHSEGLILAKE